MSDSTTNSQFFAFLRLNQNWCTDADENKDGVVTANEFKDYLGSKWDESDSNLGNRPDNDLIYKFFSSLDTNVSGRVYGTNVSQFNALDASEQAEAMLEINIYNAIYDNNALADLESVKDKLGKYYKSCKDTVEKAIVEAVKSKLISINDVTSANSTVKRIIGENVSDYYKLALEDTLKNEYSAKNEYYRFNNGFTDDRVLSRVIDAKIAQIKESLKGSDNLKSAMEIVNLIDGVVNTYKNTATENCPDSPETNDGNMSDYGRLNALQIAEIKQAFKNTLAENLAKEPGMSTELINEVLNNNSAINSYLAGKFIETQSFEKFKELLAAAKTEWYKDFIENDLDLMDIIGQAKIKKALIEAVSKLFANKDLFKEYGEKIQTMILQNSKETIDSIIDEVYKGGTNYYTLSENNEVTVNEEAILNLVKGKIQELVEDDEIKNLDADTVFGKAGEGTIELSNGTTATVIQPVGANLYESVVNENTQLDVAKNVAIIYCRAVMLRSEYRNLDGKDAVTIALGEGYKSQIQSCQTVKEVTDTVNKVKLAIVEILKEEKELEAKKKYEENIDKLLEAQNNLEINYSSLASGKENINGQFGINSNGQIFFKEDKTETLFNDLWSKIFAKIDKDAMTELGLTEAKLKKIYQASWINEYNNSSVLAKSGDADDKKNYGDNGGCSSKIKDVIQFSKDVTNNFFKMLASCKNNPAYMNIYQKNAYGNKDITDGLEHYDKTEVNYKGWVASGTEIRLANEKDNNIFDSAMYDLRVRLEKEYNYIDKSTVDSLFFEAEKKALNVASGDLDDCPCGTARNSGGNIGTNSWGNTNRDGDHFKCELKELVNLILYQFDKLLYAKLMSGAPTVPGGSGSGSGSGTGTGSGSSSGSDNDGGHDNPPLDPLDEKSGGGRDIPGNDGRDGNDTEDHTL